MCMLGEELGHVGGLRLGIARCFSRMYQFGVKSHGTFIGTMFTSERLQICTHLVSTRSLSRQLANMK
jgi:hypothetical protein